VRKGSGGDQQGGGLADSIKTHYVKRGYATADEIVLSETPKTRTVFRPGLHSGGVRGEIIRQKRSADGSWADTNEVNFNKVPPDCGVAIELDTEATTKLLEKLEQLHQIQEQGVEYGDTDFVVAKKDEVLLVDDSTKSRAIKELLENGYSEEFWNAPHREGTRPSVAPGPSETAPRPPGSH
jgi:hypothetical protein